MPSGLLLVWASGAGGFKGSVYQQLEELQGIGELGGEATEDVHHVEVFLIESLCSSVGEYPEGTAHFCCVPGQKETVRLRGTLLLEYGPIEEGYKREKWGVVEVEQFVFRIRGRD